MDNTTKETLLKCRETLEKGLNDINRAILEDMVPKPTDHQMRYVAENITALNNGDGHSWQDKYDYNLKMIRSLFQ